MASCFAKFDEVFEKDCDMRDFELLVEGKSIKVSKFVLMAHSSVFETMISSDFKEAKEGKATIEDISFEAMQEMVSFMRFGVFEEKALDLMLKVLMAADRYDVRELKDKCIDYLADSVTRGTAGKLLHMANLLNLSWLRETCTGHTLE